MSEKELDREIDMIQEAVVRSWVQTGAALICSRCQRAFVPSETSDPDLCAMCVPLRDLKLGDKTKRFPECVVCKGPVRGRRSDSLYCSDSCKKQGYRLRRRGNAETAQDDDETEDVRGDIGSDAKGGHPTREGASTT